MAVNRVSGLSSFDVDGMVKKLMDVENTKLTKVQQDRQKKIWQQDAYRSVIDKLSTFKSGYFDTLKPETNLRSTTFFAKFSSTVTVAGAASTAVSVKGTGEMENFNLEIESITKLASKDTYTSEVTNIDALVSTDIATNFAASKPAAFKVTMTIGSATKTIEVDMTDPAITDAASFTVKLNEKIKAGFGSGFDTVASLDGNSLKFRSAGNNVTLVEQTGFETSLSWMGIQSGSSTASYSTKTLNQLLSITDTDLEDMVINGRNLKSLGVSSADTLATLTSKITNAGLGASFKYDSITDKITVSSTTTGTSSELTINNTLKTKFKLTEAGHAKAENAVISVNGTTLVKSDNTFELNGAIVTLNETYTAGTGNIKMNFQVDSAKIIEKVKGFVEEYNNILLTFNSTLKEKVYRSYVPLTDDQKKDMSEDDVKLWESKAKSGSLRNSSEIESVLRRMRTALSDAVEGAGITLSQIGIETSSNYLDNGKLIIMDESKLKVAIETKYSSVVKLFSSSSDKAYLDKNNVNERYKESGLGDRLYDIIQDSVRTTRDTSGRKGSLLEIAGVKNDLSNTTSILSKSISEYDDRITTLINYLSTKESEYYSKFSRIETALSKLESQSNSLLSQLGQ